MANFSVSVDNDIYEKFQIALTLTKDEVNDAIECCMKWYIATSFGKAMESYGPNDRQKKPLENSRELYGKANRLIPKWAREPGHYNHKIVRAFFASEQKKGRASLLEMERLCSDSANVKLYVPTFKSNYAQMKLDAPKSHGRVFEDDGETVTIWMEVKETLYRYREFFTN